ncbi:MAG: GNAT family N-acetyltransferase [Candidatus Thermoplasmatota archaeon]|jgi:ribosomal protein S18 acetylase RimI-like enzyme|nr:GNAT family N-acetyltransferase [Candidatus Thermoplasmatota archaeon]MDP7264949.1 GNAT family N-acetyltransferase [Candidatus Thermoplasmatota archaeon]
MGIITVREMRRSDIEQAADIHREILRKGRVEGRTYDIGKLFGTFLEKSPNTCFVAERDKMVLGFIVGAIKDWGFGLERAGWIEMVEVDPKYMGQGVGKELGRSLLSSFKNVGITEVYTSVRWDSGDLIEFFKSIGFKKSSFINLVSK